MSIQPVYNAPYSSDIKAASSSSDPQVQKIMSQIKDWEGCPTTDPQTKRVKVAALELQLASVESGLKVRAKMNQQLTGQSSATPVPSGQSGSPGSGFDIRV
jgi:hypothetical protein